MVEIIVLVVQCGGDDVLGSPVWSRWFSVVERMVLVVQCVVERMVLVVQCGGNYGPGSPVWSWWSSVVESVVLVVHDGQQVFHRPPLHHYLKGLSTVPNDRAGFFFSLFNLRV